MFDDYGDNGFAGLAVNLNENMEIVKNYARLYTYLHWRDNMSTWAMYRQNGYIPLNYVVDANGIIRYIAEGFNETAIRNVILQWLPNPIDHDVGVKVLLAPLGGVDSAATVVPACSVYNYGTYTENYPVRMKIGSVYDQTATVTGHAPNTARYVEFPAWTPLLRGPAAVSCSTELDGDDIKSNNRITGTVTVYVYDLAVTEIIAPPDSVDSGAVVVPKVVVQNLGNWADMAKVKLYIGTFYEESVNVALQPGNIKTATLRDWNVTQVGTFQVRCTVSGRKEMIPENNILTDTVRVYSASGVRESPGAVAWSGLYDVQPNPVRGSALVRYALASPAQAELAVYSAEGVLIRKLESGVLPAGQRLVVWDGRNESGRLVGRGVYYCRLETGTLRAVRKFVVAR